MRHNKYHIISIIALSLLIKFALLWYIAVFNPDTIFMPDSPTYIEPGVNLIKKGVFADMAEDGSLSPETIRTPGYPLFLGIMAEVLAFQPMGIVAVQILLITLAGYLVYKAACLITPRGAPLALIFFLFDIPVTLTALMLLSEGLYTFCMALFTLCILSYLTSEKKSWLVAAALMLASATYIRPVSYYLGICVGLGILVTGSGKNTKQAIVRALIFLLVCYIPLGAWHYRNYVVAEKADFTAIDDIDLAHMGMLHNYTRTPEDIREKTGPVRYYASLISKSIIQFFTAPGTFKYLSSEPLKIFSKIYGYPWVAFWLLGLFFARYRSPSAQFLGLTTLYFMLVSVYVVGLCVGSRFRAPAMPFIAILSAQGWVYLSDIIKARLR